MPPSRINNTAAAGSEHGSPIFIACSKDSKRACTQCPLNVRVSPPCEWCCGSGNSLLQTTGSGHGQASSGFRDGTSHIPWESNHFPGDQSGEAAPVTCGGPMTQGRSSGTNTLSARPPLVHARIAPEPQVGDRCPNTPCFQSIAGSGHSQAASSCHDGRNHISRESRPARKHGWTTPQEAAASSIRCDPRNTTCAADRVSRDSSPVNKRGQALPEGYGGPLPDGSGRIFGIQMGKDIPGLHAPRHENGEVVTGKKKKRHQVENKRRRQIMAEKIADARRTPRTSARRWHPGRRSPMTGRRTPCTAHRYKEPLTEGGGPPADPGGCIGAKLWWRRWWTLGGFPAQR